MQGREEGQKETRGVEGTSRRPCKIISLLVMSRSTENPSGRACPPVVRSRSFPALPQRASHTGTVLQILPSTVPHLHRIIEVVEEIELSRQIVIHLEARGNHAVPRQVLVGRGARAVPLHTITRLR